MWEPRRLTTLWAFTACYRDNFTFFTFTFRKRVSRAIKKQTEHSTACLLRFLFDSEDGERTFIETSVKFYQTRLYRNPEYDILHSYEREMKEVQDAQPWGT
jgi:hypothetical protein